MPIFGGKSKTVECPMCGDQLPAKPNKIAHYSMYAIQTENGDYGWSCPCGEKDRYWTSDTRAAAGMTDHFVRAHCISQMVSWV